jgi:FkbM family methyltransferase
MRLMQFIILRRLLPKPLRARLLKQWNCLLEFERALAERRFYWQFVRAGDLVFDVGANTGIKTRAFLSLEARVIAIEPNPVCADAIRRRYQSRLASDRLRVESIAVASKQSKIILRLFENDLSISSGSDAFVSAAAADGFLSSSAIEVDTSTLDDLCRRFGGPDFIKVDVEGMDADVLRGLHFRPRFLSFEYNTKPQLWDVTLQCLRESARIGFAEANFTGSGLPKLLLARWVGLERIPTEIRNWYKGRQSFGDVIVR